MAPKMRGSDDDEAPPSRKSPRLVSQAAARSAGAPLARYPPPLARFHELRGDPAWNYLADNDAIHGGYRHRLTWGQAARSLFTWHNESVNVCTHLLGALFFVGLLCWLVLGGLSRVGAGVAPLLAGLAAEAGAAAGAVVAAEARVAAAAAAGSLLLGSDGAAAAAAPAQWPLAVFVASAATCLGGSAAFHLFHVVDLSVFNVLQSLDYAGIAVLIAGSTVPIIHYGWACRPAVGALYVGLCAAIAGVTMYVGVSSSFRSPEWRLLRMSAFICTGAFGIVPWLHLVASGLPVFAPALPRLLLMGGLYIGGALLYGFRLPERAFPGRFDMLLASHQIFHVCVFAAAAVHWRTVEAHYWWRATQAACA